jgi:exopolysaccharide biosynthesis polyprenyl glycosylphosphotransferase
MNNKEQYKRIVNFLSEAFILIMLTYVFWVIWHRFYSNNIVLPFYRKGNWAVVGIYGVLAFLFSKAYGGYKPGYLRRSDEISSQMISIVFVNIVTYFQISVIGRSFMQIYPVVIMTAVDFVFIYIWIFICEKIYRKLYPPKKLVVLYGSHQAEMLVNKMCERTDKYIICASLNVSETLNGVEKMISKYEGVIICDVPDRTRNYLLKYCFANSVRVYITPKISDIIIRGADELDLFDTPLLLCRNSGLTFEDRLFKRVFDIMFSIVAIVISSPLMLVCAAAVKKHDGGEVFYRQKRLTEGGREFYVCKFRSMVADAEKNGIPQLASENDSRVTPVGAFMRKYRIDELPQFFNVLKGDMSIVGPRPERPELAEEYSKDMPEFRFRLAVKAGITGFAQVTGQYSTLPYDKLKMDLMYIENYSVLTDLKIIFMTMKTMIFPSGNRGI